MNQIEKTDEEQMRELAEAASRAGFTSEEMAAYLNETLPAIIQRIVDSIHQVVEKMTETVSAFAEFCRNAHYVPDELLEPYGTTKELHLMKHSKKYRTRKKYRDRLTRRFEHDQQN